MPRMSRAVAEQHRRQVIATTSRLIRERGADQVSVPEAMAAAGLTHGGFYRHFSSKDDLIVQALAAAFAERRQAMDQLTDQPRSGQASTRPAGQSARAEYLAAYLGELHRDNPGYGCPAAALAADAARAEPGTPIRTAFTVGLRDLVEGLQRLEGTHDAGSDGGAALAELSTLVGAVLLARASDDPGLSQDILDAARQHLSSRSADVGEHS
jgi:TetR/AcrR family transcriptional regulator, transcriptional repressor for nem operon